MTTSAFPVYNGVAPSWAELKLVIEHDGGTFETQDFQSIDWDHGLEPGDVYGQGSGPLMRTKGKYTANAKISMLKASARALRLALAAVNPSYGLVSFTLHGSWDVGDGVIHTVDIRGARWKKTTNAGAQGSMDAWKEDIDLSVLRIYEDGVCPLAEGQ